MAILLKMCLLHMRYMVVWSTSYIRVLEWKKDRYRYWMQRLAWIMEVLFAEKGKRLYDRDGYTFDSLYLKPFRQEMQYNLTVNFYRLWARRHSNLDLVLCLDISFAVPCLLFAMHPSFHDLRFIQLPSTTYTTSIHNSYNLHSSCNFYHWLSWPSLQFTLLHGSLFFTIHPSSWFTLLHDSPFFTIHLFPQFISMAPSTTSTAVDERLHDWPIQWLNIWRLAAWHKREAAYKRATRSHHDEIWSLMNPIVRNCTDHSEGWIGSLAQERGCVQKGHKISPWWNLISNESYSAELAVGWQRRRCKLRWRRRVCFCV